MKLNLEVTTKIIDMHRRGLVSKVGQGVSLGQLVTMGFREMIAPQLSGQHEQKRGSHGLA